MKKKIWFAAATMACFVAAYTVQSFTSSGFGDSTGAPVKEGIRPAFTSCANSGCHTGRQINDATGSMEITSNIPASGWVPGTTYQINIVTTYPGRDVYGWQAMVWGHGDSASVGTLSRIPGSRGVLTTSVLRQGSRIIDTNTYFTHNTGSTVSSTMGRNEVSFLWTAPTDDARNEAVTVYASSNAANGNGNNLGDNVYIASKFFPSARLVSLPETKQMLNLKVYPNPVHETATLVGEGIGQDGAEVFVFSANGQSLLKTTISGGSDKGAYSFDVSSLPSGTHMLKVVAKNGKSRVMSLRKL